MDTLDMHEIQLARALASECDRMGGGFCRACTNAQEAFRVKNGRGLKS